jgi:hypothetical protein
MSCITNCYIVEGYDGNECFDNQGGVQELYIAPYCEFNINLITFSATSSQNGLIEAYGGTATNWYLYTQPEEVAVWSSTPTANKANNTLFFEDSVTLKFADWDYAVRDKFLLLAKGKVVVIAKNNKGNYVILGMYGGLQIASGEMTSNVTFEDGLNVTVTLTRKSANPPAEVLASVIGTDIVPSFI